MKKSSKINGFKLALSWFSIMTKEMTRIFSLSEKEFEKEMMICSLIEGCERKGYKFTDVTTEKRIKKELEGV